MKTILSLTLSAFLLCQSAVAQDYVFRVLANKGSNQVMKSGSSEAVGLKTGAKLGNGDQIIASAGAYIGLVHNTGKTIEIRTPGNHKVDELVGKVSKGTASSAGRYMNFVMNKMNEDQGDDVNSNYRRNLNATGAVERATGSAGIKVLLKDAKNPNIVYNEKAVIRWQTDEASESGYVVTVKNVFDEELYTTEAMENKYVIDFTSNELAKQNFVIVNIKSKDSESMKSRDYGIQKMAPNEAKNIEKELASIAGEASEESSLDKLMYASFYEEKKLYLDALTKYEEAIDLSPDVADFQALYNDFVESQGLGN